MKDEEIHDPYDWYYYQTSCGAPYERTEGWLSFFRGIAGRIVEDINPKTVFDAGCAKGFLVEALRDMGVDAYGIDISEYAIGEVRPDIKEFCSVGSILDPLDKTYDLIVTIEVMEHLTPGEGKRAIENLCQYTDDIIFTSTPNDYNEATHKNVQPPEYWAEIFARNGFIRDIDYDASYIAEQAMRFIRTRNTLPAIVRDYERNNYRKTLENQKLRKLALESRNELSRLHSLIEQKNSQLRNEVSSLELLVNDRDSQLALLNEQIGQLRNVVSSLELLVNDRDSQIALLNEQIGQLRNEVSSLELLVNDRDSQIALLNEQIGQLRNEVSSLELLVNDRDSQIALLNEQIGQLRNEVSSLELLVNDRDSQIAGLQEQIQEKSMHIAQLSDELNGIKKSIVWQFNMKFHTFVEKVLPPNTRRRHLYELGIKGGGILVNEGWTSFWMSVKEYRKPSEKVDNEYLQWIAENEPSEAVLKQQKSYAQTFHYLPRISIITPVYNISPDILKKTIQSVIDQTYENWELCLADGNSDNPEVKDLLKRYADDDPRIVVTFLDENYGISGNSNVALSLATGEFIGLLDHDDELAPFALYEVVKVLNKNKNVDFIYSDEDKIDDKGRRNNPFFKPDWSPDMFLSHNYLCHFSVIRQEIVQKVGAFREGYDGSQDYDLFLRVTEVLDDEEIAHIPKILYHWRMIPGSAADTVEAKPYAIIAAKKALTDALYRRGIKASVVDGLFFGSYRIRYEIMGSPKVSIIIPTKDKVNVLKICIESVLTCTLFQNYEIIIVDNQSQEQKTFDYYKKLKTNPRIRILEYNKPFNFSAMNNFAASLSEGEHLLLLNNDIEIRSEEWLSAMLEHSQRWDVGAVGAKLLYSNNTVQHAGVIIGIVGNPSVGGHAHKHLPASHPGYFGRASHIANVSAATAACMMIRREVFEEVGGFDENLAVAFNDVDLCLKIRERGYLIVYTPYATLYHHESLSRGYEDTPEKRDRFAREVRYIREKWGDVIDAGDPYYNPNLTKDKEDFSVNI